MGLLIALLLLALPATILAFVMRGRLNQRTVPDYITNIPLEATLEHARPGNPFGCEAPPAANLVDEEEKPQK